MQLFRVPNDHEARIEEKERSFQALALSKSLDESFSNEFPGGHSVSIRPMIERFANIVDMGGSFSDEDSDMCRIHPRAWNLLLTYGKDYVPRHLESSKAINWKRQPASRYCFLNSFELMFMNKLRNPRSTLSYVEGISTVANTKGAILHAWNGYGFSKNSFDWTWYSVAKWTRYFGIPFSFVECIKLGMCDGAKLNVSLLDVASFEAREDKLMDVLRTSRRKHPKESVEISIDVEIDVPFYL